MGVVCGGSINGDKLREWGGVMVWGPDWEQ